MAAAPPTGLLTISELAERTGVAPATLRSWESRYDFPRPVRLPGGHRRYAETDVEAVREVLRHRGAGLGLGAAVRRARVEPARAGSVYAELRRRHPELAPLLLPKSHLVSLSHAIEDECCARAEAPLLFGGFQREVFLRASYARWRELARTARAAVVFADLAGPAAPDRGDPGAGGLVEVALPAEAPLNREWVLVCDAPDLPACMAAVERPGQAGAADADRRFELVWTVDPQAVRLASRVAAGIADEHRPGWRPAGLAVLEEEPPGASADLRRASGLLNRMMGYLHSGS